MQKIIALLTGAAIVLVMTLSAYAADEMTIWFSPGWKSKGQQARSIAKALTDKTGMIIKPRIARSYPEILKAFDTEKMNLVYVGYLSSPLSRQGVLVQPLSRT
jgi:hypothetical protein